MRDVVLSTDLRPKECKRLLRREKMLKKKEIRRMKKELGRRLTDEEMKGLRIRVIVKYPGVD